MCRNIVAYHHTIVVCLLSASFSGFKTEPVLVDSSKARWQTLEPQQLQDGHDPGFGWRGGNSGTHTFQS